MSRSTPATVARIARAWVRLYTRGLPTDLRSARRAELDSDLWEHEQQRTSEGVPPRRVALEIAVRLLAGLPADLSWRLEHARSRRRANGRRGGAVSIEALRRHGMTALAVALGAWSFAVVPLLAGADDWIQGAVSAVFGLLIWVGLIAARRAYRGGRAAVAVGSVGAGLLVIWSVVPAIVAVAVLIWLFGSRDLRRIPPQPA